MARPFTIRQRPAHRTAHRAGAGFSLVELLVVIGIIALLVGILMPALTGARRSAREVKSLSNLHQMMLGYTAYHAENKGGLLLGYTPPTVNGRTIRASDPVSHQSFGSPVADRYPWRLLPYVGNIWQILHAHAAVPPLPAPGDSVSTAFLKAYTLSLDPTYGINAVFVGGQQGSDWQGFGGKTGDVPLTGKHVVFRASEVKHPSNLIVFADSQCMGVASLAGQGLHYLTPPHAHGHNWQVTQGEFDILKPGSIMGIPNGWYSKRAMVAFFDGHCESMTPDQLTDMRMWCNIANSQDYDYAP